MISNKPNNCFYFAVKNFSELNSFGWLSEKKETIISGDNDFERISKLKPYISKYNWERIDLPAGPKDWIKSISIAYRSEYNNKRKEQVTLLIITDGKKWHFLAVINLSALLQGNSSNHEGDFYCSNCFS